MTHLIIRSLCIFVASFALWVSYGVEAREPVSLDNKLRLLIDNLEISGNPAKDSKIPDIQSSDLAQLGRSLFFSKALSINFDVACATCHHPLLAGGDGLSLPVGVGAIDGDHIGPGRRHDGNFYIDPEADGGPNVERNSPSTFNTAFYNFSLFYDGRVEAITWQDGSYLSTRELLDRQTQKTINPSHKALTENRSIKTPDSIFRGPDTLAGDDLLQAQARFPVTAAAEMRGLSSHFGGSSAVRSFLEKRFQGETGELKGSGWQARFRKAFERPDAPLKEVITFQNITRALAEYQRSQVFISNPWKAYLENRGDISTAAKRGALLFFSAVKDGGGGCSRCHSGDFFTNENFYNLAIPQFGRGNFVYGQDLGRHPITRNDKDMFAFRVPTLLNIEVTAPYGHTGAFTDLEGVIRHHLDPRKSVESYDFTLQHLPQFKGLDVVYPEARANTRRALKKLLEDGQMGMPQLSAENISDVVEFLKTLTDPCIKDGKCLQPWLPNESDSDKHQLTAKIPGSFNNTIKISVVSQPPSDHKTVLPVLKHVPEYAPQCKLTRHPSSGQGFSRVTNESGIAINRGFDFNTLKPSLVGDGLVVMEHLLFSGGVAAGDINGDCLSDLIINQGNAAGAIVYLNKGDGTFIPAENNWGIDDKEDLTGPMLVDLNGDRWLDLFHGNIYGASPGIWINDGSQFIRVSKPGFRVGHVTLGAGFGDVDGDGDLDAFLAHWSRPSKAEEEHLWLNNGNGLFTPGARKFRLTGHFGERDFTFTPNFPDLNNDGKVDLLSTADFMTSQVFLNKDNELFLNKTDKQVITDHNGMGAAIADFDNDGDLDWFVTSIYYPPMKNVEPDSEDYDSFANGNRLYRNDGFGEDKVTFSDVTDIAGVRKGGWGWGACAADFDNDGWLDIFHTNGLPFDASQVRKDLHYLFPVINIQGFHDVLPYETYKAFEGSVTAGLTDKQKEDLEALYYVGKKLDTLYLRGKVLDGESKLFMNKGDGTFRESSKQLGIADPGQGRGISCLDYDRDGDIDILIVNNQGSVSLYRNDFGNNNNFLTIRLRGRTPNTYGVGARIYLETASGKQMREVMIENNYISQNPVETHFGLNQDEGIDKLAVIWPDGKQQVINNVGINQIIEIDQVNK
ncbi:FG-GAP-like repeat-containing protein [Endozoicomonas sp. Mp262]|uniref:FG-GAP-like repeat-containing protein n=1 Tax=Endozoicomonas sp. Mp262 TaxID=2919499 RepID=UPI0021DA52AD